MAFKYLILVMLVLILISLGKALYHLSSTREDDGKKLFVLLIVAYYSGWIDPQHVAPGHSQ
jgi:hypothetical protein